MQGRCLPRCLVLILTLPSGHGPGGDSEKSQKEQGPGPQLARMLSAKTQQSFVQMNPVTSKINGRIYKHIIVSDVR